MRRALRAALGPLGLSLLAGAASADSYDYVLQPYPEAGPTLRLGAGALRRRDGAPSAGGQSLAFGMSLLPRWYSELWVSWERDRGRPRAYNGWYWSNQLWLGSTARSDWALYFSYWKPDFARSGWEWTVGPMLQLAQPGYDLNFNLLLRKWLREDRPRPAELAYQAQIKTLWRPGWEWGLQALGELGPAGKPDRWQEQTHELGPALFGHQSLGRGSLRYDLGLLLGLTEASPRARLRAQLSYQF